MLKMEKKRGRWTNKQITDKSWKQADDSSGRQGLKEKGGEGERMSEGEKVGESVEKKQRQYIHNRA